jgi:hypothetical protein
MLFPTQCEESERQGGNGTFSERGQALALQSTILDVVLMAADLNSES